MNFYEKRVKIKGNFEVLKKVFYFPYIRLKERAIRGEIGGFSSLF